MNEEQKSPRKQKKFKIKALFHVKCAYNEVLTSLGDSQKRGLMDSVEPLLGIAGMQAMIIFFVCCLFVCEGYKCNIYKVVPLFCGKEHRDCITYPRVHYSSFSCRYCNNKKLECDEDVYFLFSRLEITQLKLNKIKINKKHFLKT